MTRIIVYFSKYNSFHIRYKEQGFVSTKLTCRIEQQKNFICHTLLALASYRIDTLTILNSQCPGTAVIFCNTGPGQG